MVNQDQKNNPNLKEGMGGVTEREPKAQESRVELLVISVHYWFSLPSIPSLPLLEYFTSSPHTLVRKHFRKHQRSLRFFHEAQLAPRMFQKLKMCLCFISLLQSWAGAQGVDPAPPACEEETGNCVWILVNPHPLCDISSFIFIRWQTKSKKNFYWWHFSVFLSYGNFVLCIDVHTEDAEWLLFEIQICLVNQKVLFIFKPQIRFKNKAVCKTKKTLLAAHRK